MSKKRTLFNFLKVIDLLVIFVMTFGSPMTTLAAVWSDQADYSPGSVVTISGDNSDGAGYLPGETVHVDVWGPNGYTSACEGAADAAGAWSCQVTLWDSLLAVGTYTYTATGLSSLVSQGGTFTDAVGDFSLDFAAAAPYSYNHLTGGGAFDDGTIGKNADVVESLEAVDFACGDIVTFFTKVSVDDTTRAGTDAPQTIELDYEFLMDTTGQPGVAIGDIVYVGVNYGTIQDLISGENTVDDGIVEYNGTPSVATLIAETQTAPMFTKGAKLQGTVQVTGLDRNEDIIVRIDTKLFCNPGDRPTGNLQADLTAARLTYIQGTVPVTPPAAISAGNQTIPFYQFGELNIPEIVVQKTVTTAGGVCPDGETLSVYAGTQVKYCYVITNPSSTTNPPGAPLYNVTLVDDNGTPANTADDFPVTLTGLTDVDMDGAADDLAAGGTAYGEALVTLATVGTVVNTATATGYDAIVYPTPFTDTDTASVTVNPPPVVAPMPRVVKGNAEGNDTVATLSEPGGSVTINVVVYNDAAAGTGDATLISLTDDIYGDVTTTGHNGITATTCATGGVIAGGSSYSCSFTVSINSEPATILDTLAATLQNTNSSVSDTDQANVVISNVPPAVDLVKDVTPATLAEPGGVFNYTLTINNTSAEAVTITALTDDNPLPAACTGLIGQSIPAGGSLSCTYSVTHTEPGTYPNTASVTVQDNDGSTASDSDNESVTVTDVAPAITVDKSANPTSLPEPGGNVEFTVIVTNNSIEPVTLTSLADNVYGDLNGQGTCATGDAIAAGGSYTCSFTGAVSGGPGSHTDRVAAVATDNDGTTATGADDATVELTDVAPAIRITKSASPTSVPETGGYVTFTFLVENIGQEDVTLTSLSDTVFGDLNGKGTCEVPQTILIGGSYSCTYTTFLSSGELTAHYNLVTATAVDDDNTSATDDDDETVTFDDMQPTVDLTKTADPQTLAEPGGAFQFTLSIHNTSAEAVTITALTDTNALSAECQALVGASIPAGGTVNCTYPVTHTEVGSYANTASVTVQDNENNTASDADSEAVTVTNVLPAVDLTKTAEPQTLPEPGGAFQFTLTIHNTSIEPVTITDLADDNALSAECQALVSTNIPAGGTVACTYSVTHTEAGVYDNTASVTVVDNEGSSASDSDDETVSVTDVLPAVDLIKTADPQTLAEPGGAFQFTLSIHNTSAEAVKISTLTDTNALSAECQALVGTSIPAGGTVTCTYSVTHTEAGAYENTASVTVADNEGNTASDSDSETVTVTDTMPVVDLTKDVAPATLPEPGGAFHFTLTFTNNSVEDVTITALTDSNPLPAACTDLIGVVLPAGQSVACEYDVTHTEAGSYENTASVTVEDNEGNPASDTDTETVTVTDVLPDITVTKTASPTSVPETGGLVMFTFVIANNSPEAVTISSLSDSIYGTLDGDDDCKIDTVMASGASCDFAITRWVAGNYSGPDHINVFTGKATDNDGNEDTATDDATVDFTDVAPAIRITKTADPTHVPETGGDVTFTFLVENTGQEAVTLNSLIDDVFVDLTAYEGSTCVLPQAIAVGGSYNCSITVFLASDSLAPHTNVVTAKAEDDDGTEATDDDDETVTFDDVRPDITVTKTANPTSVPETGGLVNFTFVVTNNGPEAVTISSLSDSLYGTLNGDTDCAVGTVLASRASCEFAITRWVEGDYSGPDHMNVFTAKASDNDGNEDTATDDATVDFTNVLPAIEVTKTADPTAVPETGANVVFTFVVKNTSMEEPVTITSLVDSVYGTLAGDADCAVGTVLAAGASCEFALTKWVEGDYSGPDHVNTFTALAEDNDGTDATDDDDATVDFSNVLPAIEVTKTANPTAVPETGANVVFTFVVKNTSTEEPVIITSLVDSVYGMLAGDADCTVGIVLAAGASCEFALTKWVEGDYSGSDHVNVFTAKAVDNDNTEATDSDNETVDFTDVLPDISVTKTADQQQVFAPGEDVTFDFVVTNNGLEAVTIRSLSDSVYGTLAGDDDCEAGTELAAGASCTFSITRLVSSDHENTFTAMAADDDGNTDEASATTSVDMINPSIAIDKVTVDGTTEGDGLNILIGESITWKYLVTNDGDVALTGISVTDSKVLSITCPKTTLAAGESMTCTASGTAVTGSYSNKGTVTTSYTDLDGHKAERSDSDESSYFGADPQITLVKTTADAHGNEGDGVGILPGETVTWKYLVTNVGNVELVSVGVTDDQGVAVDCPKDTLAAGESMTCTATGTAAAGWYNNTGTASGSFTDGGGHARTDTASDPSSYYGLTPGGVTNSMLCDFGDTFRLIFTPDSQRYTTAAPYYKLSDSNPGQFFYNLFYTNNGSTENLTLEIPYPFVTQGAMPVHVYGGLFVNPVNGDPATPDNLTNCFLPQNPLAAYGSVITLNSYTDTNGDGKVGYGDVVLVEVPAAEGFQYVNIHLDYGLEKTNGWLRKGANVTGDGTVNPAVAGITINDHTGHTFQAYADGELIPGSADTVYNYNEFKQVRGFGGLVYKQTGVDEEGNPVYEALKGAEVQLRKKGSLTLIETMTTDVDGWYLSDYIHKGKTATYTLTLVGTAQYPSQSIEVTVGGNIKYGEGNFFIDLP